jgi:hypothetical protein
MTFHAKQHSPNRAGPLPLAREGAGARLPVNSPALGLS